VTIGFALETDHAVAQAAAKLSSKSLDLVVVNDAREPGSGFAVDTNRVTILGRDGSRADLPLLPKTDVADAILDRAGALLSGR
jgi:phosphopantothenoylcysteine decarboxylase/phosphopantothenate--cysteine ligase